MSIAAQCTSFSICVAVVDITHVEVCCSIIQFSRVSDLNSSLSDLYTSMKDDFSLINVYLQE